MFLYSAHNSQMHKNYQYLVNDTEVGFLIGPVNSDFSIAAREVVQPYSRLLVATSAGSDLFYKDCIWCFSVLIPASRTFDSAMPLLRYKGVKTVAYISESQPFTAGACRVLRRLFRLPNVSLGNTINSTR